jgi:GT2 family glycosyltransferase
MTPHVLFVVPTFNRAAELPRTIGAIAEQHWPADRMAVLVVDNSSTDDTPRVLTDLKRRLRVPVEHLRKAPEGPTVARNIGLQRGLGRLVALVDSDVELDPHWTEATVAALAAEPELAQVGGKLLFGHDPDLLNSYGGALGRLGLAWDLAEGEPASSETEPRDVLWISTSAVLMRPEPILAVGGFDEGFFLGGEEPDLGLRLAIAGWRSRVVPEARAFHHTGTMIGRIHPDAVFHSSKNRLRMILKSFGPARLLWLIPASLGYVLLDAALHRPRSARLRALSWNVNHLRETLRLRDQTQNRRTTSDHDALKRMTSRWFPPTRLAGLRRRIVPGMTVKGADRKAECVR